MVIPNEIERARGYMKAGNVDGRGDPFSVLRAAIGDYTTAKNRLGKKNDTAGQEQLGKLGMEIRGYWRKISGDAITEISNNVAGLRDQITGELQPGKKILGIPYEKRVKPRDVDRSVVEVSMGINRTGSNVKSGYESLNRSGLASGEDSQYFEQMKRELTLRKEAVKTQEDYHNQNRDVLREKTKAGIRRKIEEDAKKRRR